MSAITKIKFEIEMDLIGATEYQIQQVIKAYKEMVEERNQRFIESFICGHAEFVVDFPSPIALYHKL